MLPYILKICGFKNSIVYRFYSMYQKYTVFVKLYICGLTYRLSVRYKHKLRIDVITYIPTLANGPPSAAVCLLPVPLLSYPAGPSSIPTSGHQQDIRSTAPGRRSTSLWWWIPGVDLWDGIPAAAVISSVGSLLRWVARKNFLAKSGADPRNPQMIPVYPGFPAGEITKFLEMSFWRIIRLLMISASIQKL